MSGGNHRALGRHVEGRGDERDRVGHGERRHHRHERAQPPERNHEAEQEQQVVDAVEDVEEPVLREAQGRLVPARIEFHDAGLAVHVEGPLGGRRARAAAARRSPASRAVSDRAEWRTSTGPTGWDTRSGRRASRPANRAGCRRAGPGWRDWPELRRSWQTTCLTAATPGRRRRWPSAGVGRSRRSRRNRRSRGWRRRAGWAPDG